MDGRIGIVAVALLSTSSWARAQGTITDPPATFVLGPTAFDSTPDASFTGVSTPGGDHLFQTGWAFRIAGDTRETFFPVPTTQDYTLNQATLAWTNVGGRGFDALLSYVVSNRPGATGGGIVDGRLTITNSGATTLVMDAVFNMIDFDVQPDAGNDSATLVTANRHIRIDDPGGNIAEYRGVDASGFLVRPFGPTSVGAILDDAAVDQFNNTGVPFGPGDLTAGLQWPPIGILPGGRRSYAVAFSVNYAMDHFFTIAPCRVIDTRLPPGHLGGPALVGGSDRQFTVAGNCGVPVTAKAISYNVAVATPSNAGNLRVFPSGGLLPVVASINYSAGQTRSNNGIVGLNSAGSITVRCGQTGGTTEFILDVNGYFQ